MEEITKMIDVSRITGLEYHLIRNRDLCFELRIARTQEEPILRCKTLTKNKFRGMLLELSKNTILDSTQFKQKIDDFLDKRETVLSQIEPVVKPHIQDLGVIEEERENGESEEAIEEEEEEPLAELSTLELVSQNAHILSSSVQNYMESYCDLCVFLIRNFPEQHRSIFDETVSLIANIDTVAIFKQGIEGQLLVSLDISPQRLALALNRDVMGDEDRNDRFFIPPILIRKFGEDYITFHAYRTLDARPSYIPGINIGLTISKDISERYYHLIKGAQKIFNSIKKARKGRPPRLLRKKLAEILLAYVQANPMAQDKLSLASLGAGKGGLMARICDEFLIEGRQKRILHERSNCKVLINDLYEEQGTGRDFMDYASRDAGLVYITETQRLIEDMRDSIKRLKDLAKTGEFSYDFDVCFINRVFDVYARYGFYRFPLKWEIKGISARTASIMDIDGRGKSLAYSDLAVFSSLHELQRSVLLGQKPRLDYLVLPGLQYFIEKDFFNAKGISLKDIFDFSNLVIMSMYPGTTETVFSGINGELHTHSVYEKEGQNRPVYVIFCVSKDEKIIKSIRNLVGS
jgi:hypothetical protein